MHVIVPYIIIVHTSEWCRCKGISLSQTIYQFPLVLRLILCWNMIQVEDMLKRSFAEFHAQKKLPEQQQLLMRKLAQPAKAIE